MKREDERNIMSGDWGTIALIVPGTLSTGDGKAYYQLPQEFRCIVREIFAVLGSKGDTSGATTINVRNATDTEDLMASGSRISIAYDASVPYARQTFDGLQNYYIDQNTVLAVDIDAVPGTASEDLLVLLYVERATIFPR